VFSCAALGSAFLKSNFDFSRPIALGVVFLLGALMIQVRPPADPGYAILPFANRTEVTLIGHVIKEGGWENNGPNEIRQLLDMETEEITADGKSIPIRSGIRIGIYAKQTTGSAQPVPLHYGQRLRLVAKLSAPHNYNDPGVFDYREYLAEHQIAALGSSKAETVEVLPGFAGSQIELWRSRVHRSIIHKIETLWPPDQAALLDAMVIGDDSFLPHPVKLEFQRTGTYHLLVVSGLNVGILAYVFFWTFRRLRLAEWLASFLTVLLIVAYAVLTDIGPPVWRATLMLTLFLGARLLYRERSMLNAIGVAALGVLLADPQALFGASFQLTFLSVLLIAGIGVPILERTSQPYLRGLRQLNATAYDAHLPPPVAQFRIDLRLIASRLRPFFGPRFPLPTLRIVCRLFLGTFEILFISAILQLGLALPMAYYFHRVTVTALPANIVVLPLMEVLMPAAVLAVALGYCWLWIARIPALIASWALKGITGTLGTLGGLRVADTRVAMPSPFVIAAAVLAIAAAMLLARRRLRYAGMGLVLLWASAAWIALVPPQPQWRHNALEVTAIDVGQGDSLLIVFPQGQTMLLDAGGMPSWMHSDFDVGEEVVSQYLWSRGISHLDAAVVSHPHADHIGGMRAVLANFHPRQLWIGANSWLSPEMQVLLHEARMLRIPATSHGEGDEFIFAGTSIQIFAPPKHLDIKQARNNEDSLVIRITYGRKSVLLEGDAEKKTEQRIVGDPVQAALLKVAHHGSATSTIPEFLDAVQPHFAVISVGANNVYGHPRFEVLQRLAEARVTTYRTDVEGAVSFYLDSKGISVRVAALR
jgi:competence protein ComEC